VAVTAPSGLVTAVAMRLAEGSLTGSVCWAEVGRYEVRALLEQEWASNSGLQVFAIPLHDSPAAEKDDGVLRLSQNESKSLANNRLTFSLSSQRRSTLGPTHAPGGGAGAWG
jgi:hypothetical protein